MCKAGLNPEEEQSVENCPLLQRRLTESQRWIDCFSSSLAQITQYQNLQSAEGQEGRGPEGRPGVEAAVLPLRGCRLCFLEGWGPSGFSTLYPLYPELCSLNLYSIM